MHEEKLFLWARVVTLSFACHIIMIIALFWCYRYDAAHVMGLMNRAMLSQAPVMFLPSRVLSSSVGLKKVQKSDLKPVATPVKDVSKVAPKKEEKKVSKEVTIKKELPQKNSSKSVGKKEEPKEQLIKEKQADQKPVAQDVKPVDLPPKQIQEKVVPEQKEIEPVSNYIENVIDDSTRLFLLVQEKLVASWRPPVGVAKDSCCTISFCVSLRGQVEQVAVQESSGILMYDISVRAAVLNAQMPRWARGKSFTISFHA